MFELIFAGESVPEIPLATVKVNMQKLFKASPEQIAAMFSGQKVVLKNKLDKPTALKYQAILKKNGAVCRIALMTTVAAQPATTQPATAQATTNREAPAAAATSASTPGQSAPQKNSPDNSKPRIPESETPAPEKTATPTTVLTLAPVKASFGIAPPSTVRPASETGHLPLAGEKVEGILAGKDISVAPTGVRLGEYHEVEALVFERLDEIDLAEIGADMAVGEKLPPPPAPDVSHLSVAVAGSDLGQLKKEVTVVVPDISRITLKKNE